MIDWHYSLSGLLVGAFVGITGVGGGSLMTPILVLIFGIHPVTAVGTDLLYAAITKFVGTIVHGRNQTVNWRIVRLLAAGSIPGALLTLLLISATGRLNDDTARFITTTLGGMLLVTSALLVFRGPLTAMRNRRLQSAEALRLPQDYPLPTVVLGFVLGMLVTLTSVGAGALGVTLMLFLYPRLRLTDIIGSDIAHAVPLTLISGIGYWAIGGVDWHMLGSLLVGSIPGIIAGSLIAVAVSDRLIRPILAIILAVVGLKLVLAS